MVLLLIAYGSFARFKVTLNSVLSVLCKAKDPQTAKRVPQTANSRRVSSKLKKGIKRLARRVNKGEKRRIGRVFCPT